MDVNRFQIHFTRLPEKAQRRILRQMDAIHIIGISFLSKKTKELVKSLNMTPFEAEIEVHNTVRFWLFRVHCDFYTTKQSQDGELSKPESIRVRQFFDNRKREEWIWTNEDFEMKEWTEHFQTIFHIQNFTTLIFGNLKFDIGKVLNTLKNVTRLWLRHYFGNNRPIVEKQLQLHRVKELKVDAEVFPNNEVPRNILIQNLDRIDVQESQGSMISLNNLLYCGSIYLIVRADGISSKDLNRFIKLWQKGSNPQLESILLMVTPSSLNLETVFKHVDYKHPPEEIRYFKSEGCKCTLKVEGDWDITRNDGTKATIFASVDYGYFRMYVWHDHCVSSAA